MQNLVKRDLIKSIVLSFVTLGIYDFYWCVKLSREIARFEDETASGAKEILISLLCPFAGVYVLGRKLTNACEMKGLPAEDHAILACVISLLCTPIGGFAVLQNDVNRLVEKYGAAEDPGAFDGFGPAAAAGAAQNGNPIDPPFGAVKYCLKCGAANDSSKAFCSACGGTL